MSDQERAPDAGDLIWTDFDPRIGREKSGRRPALIVSPAAFYVASRFVIVCPIMARVRPFASSVVLPDGLAIGGEILMSHVRSIDTMARGIELVDEMVPNAVLMEVRAKLATLLGIPS
ncbi:MAG: type II toxin-antitoxin system PemK/MazF family toxin [Geminicoccaceae bacterium]